MFKLIDSHNKNHYTAELQEMFSRRKRYQLSLDTGAYDHDKSVYLFFKDPKTTMFGCARLNPSSSKNMVGEKVGLFFEGDEAWECSSLAFDIEDNHPIQNDPEQFEAHCSYFYSSLYDALMTTCATLKIKKLLFFNTQDELDDMSFFGGVDFDRSFCIDEKNGLTLAVMNADERRKQFNIH